MTGGGFDAHRGLRIRRNLKVSSHPPDIMTCRILKKISDPAAWVSPNEIKNL